MMKRNKLTTTRIQYASYILVSVFMLVYAFLIFYPFIWAFLSSFMTPREYFDKTGQIFPIPSKFNFGNYIDALNTVIIADDKLGITRQYTIMSMVWNTLFVTIVRTFLGMICPVCAAYCCAKYKFFGSNFFFFYGVIFCSVPFYGGTVVIFKYLHLLNLYNTYAGIFILSIQTFGGFLFYFGFFKALSWEYAEAGFIDGASDFRVFYNIMLPQIFPILFTFMVGGFIGNWNDWMTNYLYLPSKPMVAYGVYQLNVLATIEAKWTVLFAGIFLSLTVPLAFFLFFSKRIMATVYTGGLKG